MRPSLIIYLALGASLSNCRTTNSDALDTAAEVTSPPPDRLCVADFNNLKSQIEELDGEEYVAEVDDVKLLGSFTEAGETYAVFFARGQVEDGDSEVSLVVPVIVEPNGTGARGPRCRLIDEDSRDSYVKLQG